MFLSGKGFEVAYIRELPNGKFKVCWRENLTDDFGAPIKGKYKQRVLVVDSEKAAERERIRIEDRIDSGTNPTAYRDKVSRPLGEYAKVYFDSAESRIGEVTLNGYREIYRRHVSDTFGARPIGTILPSDVSAWFSGLLAGDSNRWQDAQTRTLAKRSPKTAKQALGVLRRICNVALADGAITANPALLKIEVSHKRTGRKFKHIPLSPNQLAILGDSMSHGVNGESLQPKSKHASNVGTQPNPIYALAVTFTAYTGPRAAELAGLEIRDIDLLRNRVSIERTKTRDYSQASGFRVDELAKSDESTDRFVPLESWLASDLQDYLTNTHPNANDPQAPLFPGRLNLAEAKALGRNVKDSADRFDWSKPIDPNNVYKRFMQPALQRNNLPAARFHDLRHSFAVNLLSANVDFKRVSKWLGHSTFTLTLDVYGDYIHEDLGQPGGLARPIATQSNVVPLERRNA